MLLCAASQHSFRYHIFCAWQCIHYALAVVYLSMYGTASQLYTSLVWVLPPTHFLLPFPPPSLPPSHPLPPFLPPFLPPSLPSRLPTCTVCLRMTWCTTTMSLPTVVTLEHRYVLCRPHAHSLCLFAAWLLYHQLGKCPSPICGPWAITRETT